MLSNDTNKKQSIIQSRGSPSNQIIDLDQHKSFYDEQLKKSRIQVSFESGQLSQMRLFESFKIRHQFDKEESVEDCETFTHKDILKRAENDYSNPSSQFDLQVKSQQKVLNKQPMSKDMDSQQSINVSVFKNKAKKTSVNSVGGEIDDANAFENNQYGQLNDSRKLNKKELVQENDISQINEDPNISHQYNHNNEDKNPLTKSILYSRRGSRKTPGLNASGQLIKENNGINTPIHLVDKFPIERQNQLPAQKGGFFFAMKMKKYANQLVSRLQSRRYIGLRHRHLQFFNDKTIIPNDELGAFKNGGHAEDPDGQEVESTIHIQKRFILMIKKFYQRIIPQKIRQTIKLLPLFSPSHTIKLIWDFLNMISIAYFLIFFPLRIAFGLDIHQSSASYLALGIIFFDILVYLNTGFYDKGALVNDRIGILIHYIDSRFFTDVLSMIPFIFYDFSDAKQNVFQDKIKLIESAISLLFLVRVSHLGQIKKKIEEKFYQKKTLTHIISLLTLLSLTLYIAHLFSCFWIIIAQYQIESQDTWMQFAKVDGDNWLVQYLFSLYFLIITMTTVGYGDIKPQNNIEHLFIIIIVLISSGVFSFSINKIGYIVQQMSEEKEKLKVTLQVINNYMNKKNINMNLQQQIREYLEYYLKESLMNDNETEDKIIDMLSEPLKRSLMIEANKIALKDSPIFRNNFSEATIQKTVSLIQELRCTPEEVLFYEGDIDNNAIFFVQQGKVELFIDSYKSTGETIITSLKVFSKGSSFGETSFFTGAARGISIRSIDFTTLLMIKRQDFLNVVKESSDDYENYCKIRDKIMLYKNFDDLGIKCISCNSRTHFLNDCPYIHFVPDKEKIIKIDQRPTIAERAEYDDPRIQKYNVLTNLKEINEDQNEYIEQNLSFLERQDWFYGEGEDDDDHEIYNQYDDDDEEEDNRLRDLEASGPDINNKYQNKQQDGNIQNDQLHHQTSLTHHFKEDSYVPHVFGERISLKKEDTQYGNGIKIDQCETHSYKSGIKQLNNLEVDEKRDKSASNMALNDLALTPSGLVLNLINPNPGNIKENSQSNYKRKISTPIPILTTNAQVQFQINPQQVEESGVLQNSNYINSQGNYVSYNSNTNISIPKSNNPIREINNNFTGQQTIERSNSLVRKNTKRKNTEQTLRSINKRKSTKKTIDSRMNVQITRNPNERKSTLRKQTVFRKGLQEYQIQNTLLAIQGMENILLQNKSNTNEFDIMKCFEIYFPHNNIDIVIFQLRKKNPHLYAKQKSFAKSNTKKLYGAATMNSQHNRMSKMDIVLQKFLMSELDDDKDSLNSKQLKSFTQTMNKNDTHKTPKTSYANEMTHSKHRQARKSHNISNHDIELLTKSPIKSKTMKSMTIALQPEVDIDAHLQQRKDDDESSVQQSSHHDEIYFGAATDPKQVVLNKSPNRQSSMVPGRFNIHNRKQSYEEDTPKKNVSFQDNLNEIQMNISNI